MSDKIIKLTPAILKKIVEEERKTLAEQAKKVSNDESNIDNIQQDHTVSETRIATEIDEITYQSA